jgi:hypothetical protein
MAANKKRINNGHQFLGKRKDQLSYEQSRGFRADRLLVA